MGECGPGVDAEPRSSVRTKSPSHPGRDFHYFASGAGGPAPSVNLTVEVSANCPGNGG